MLEVSPENVCWWARTGKLTHVRLPSGRVCYRKSAILALLVPVGSEERESESESVDDEVDSLDVPSPALVGM